MRRAQALLDEAQAERSRTLAAFAVTVGDDGSIADLMGLNEREVRLARRTVGRSDARSLAQELLTRKTPKTEESSDEPAAPGPEIPLPHPREEMAAPAADAGAEPPPVPPVPAMPPTPPPAPQPQAGTGDHTAAWSPSMDSVLLWSWESGLDVQTVAAELGLDVRSLLMRLQELANDGMLTLAHPVTEVTRSGRHRRQNFDDQAYAALFSPTATFPTPMPY
ncbi:hypothetical protein [Streptomyces sp. PTD5-9]|uniref:hypothetical protein n=1 Tax=Streptomyces sp. PTD5-9 TaxID=3120150 RepID=UPI0030092853